MFHDARAALTANLQNPNTREAYSRAAAEFDAWCARQGLVDPLKLGERELRAYVGQLEGRLGASAIKQRLAAVRALLREAGLGQLAALPVVAPSVRPKRGREPAPIDRLLLHVAERCAATRLELRDRALIHFLAVVPVDVPSAVRLSTGSVIVPTTGREQLELHGPFRSRGRVDVGDRSFVLPAKLQSYLAEYIDATGLAVEEHGWLFRTMRRQSDRVSDFAISRIDAWRILRRRSEEACLPACVMPKDLMKVARLAQAELVAEAAG